MEKLVYLLIWSLGMYSCKYDCDCLKRRRAGLWAQRKSSFSACFSSMNPFRNWRVIIVFWGVVHGNMKVMELFISHLQNWGNKGILRINDELSEMFVICHEEKEPSTTCLLDTISMVSNSYDRTSICINTVIHIIMASDVIENTCRRNALIWCTRLVSAEILTFLSRMSYQPQRDRSTLNVNIPISAISYIYSTVTGRRANSVFSATAIPGLMLPYIKIIPMSSMRRSIQIFNLGKREC